MKAVWEPDITKEKRYFLHFLIPGFVMTKNPKSSIFYELRSRLFPDFFIYTLRCTSATDVRQFIRNDTVR